MKIIIFSLWQTNLFCKCWLHQLSFIFQLDCAAFSFSNCVPSRNPTKGGSFRNSSVSLALVSDDHCIFICLTYSHGLGQFQSFPLLVLFKQIAKGGGMHHLFQDFTCFKTVDMHTLITVVVVTLKVLTHNHYNHDIK